MSENSRSRIDDSRRDRISGSSSGRIDNSRRDR